MDLEKLLAELAKAPNGSVLVEAVKKLFAEEDTKSTEALNKLKLSAKESKEATTKAEMLQKQLSHLREKLGLDEDGDVAEALDNITKAKTGPDSETSKLTKRLEKLEKEKAADKKNYDEQIAAEKGKRETAVKREALMKVLGENKAARPEDLIELLISKVEIGTDDSISFEGGKKLSDGVKTWLGERPEFIKNSQVPGASSNLGAGRIMTDQKDAQGNQLSLGASLAAPIAAANKAAATSQAHFFGQKG